MYIENTLVESIQQINKVTYLIKVLSPSISSIALPGQFCNIKVSENSFPLLRRPFSICNVEKDSLYFLFDIHGEGTKILSKKKVGDVIDILGPSGKGFDFGNSFKTAIIVAGGLGTAPFPFLIEKLSSEKQIVTLVGGRTKEQVIKHGLINVIAATDDGTTGFHGNVVDLLKHEINNYSKEKLKIFGCGPTPMLKALQGFCIENNYDCQISVEREMACGFGICQGCPIESNEENYLLVCKDGPVFDAKKIKL